MNEKQRVLAVDDDTRNLRIISEILQDESDITLQTCTSGQEGLTLLKSFRPNVILLDVMMPEMNGYEFCEVVKRDPETASVYIILISGRVLMEERLKGYEVGADDYITKPYLIEELLTKTKTYLKLSKLERELMDLKGIQELSQSKSMLG